MAKSVSDFISNLIQSMVIVLAVMLLFLGLRTGVVVASLIPTAIVMSLFLMGVFDIGLNQVSLAALIMALGMLIVIVTGHIDLSVGSVMGFVGALAAVMIVELDQPLFEEADPSPDAGLADTDPLECLLPPAELEKLREKREK